MWMIYRVACLGQSVVSMDVGGAAWIHPISAVEE